jgi:hypothetical protein
MPGSPHFPKWKSLKKCFFESRCLPTGLNYPALRDLSNIFTYCKYMRYTWSERKNVRNARLHGIAFQDAVGIFDGPTLEQEDDRFDYGERRVYAIGLVKGLEITVMYTDRSEDEHRIISAWRSEPHERRAYWRSIEGLTE